MKLDYSEVERMCDDAISQLQLCTRKVGMLKEIKPKIIPNSQDFKSTLGKLVIKKNGIKLETGTYFVEKGAVSAILNGATGGSCMVERGEVVFVPKDFYIRAIIKSVLTKCTPDENQIHTFISDQMEFTSRLKTYNCYDQVKWLCQRLSAMSDDRHFVLCITALATTLGLSREMVGGAVAILIKNGGLKKVKVKYHPTTYEMIT